jgi:hypothetical protein
MGNENSTGLCFKAERSPCRRMNEMATGMFRVACSITSDSWSEYTQAEKSYRLLWCAFDISKEMHWWFIAVNKYGVIMKILS